MSGLAFAAGILDVDFFRPASIEYRHAVMLIISLFPRPFPPEFDLAGFICAFCHELDAGPYQLRHLAIRFIQSIGEGLCRAWVVKFFANLYSRKGFGPKLRMGVNNMASYW
jgi:hypothetical protein